MLGYTVEELMKKPAHSTVAQEDLGKLFTPFPDILVDGNAGGTDLCLSICKGIIELHEGKIWVESRGKEQGSVFSFTLPR